MGAEQILARRPKRSRLANWLAILFGSFLIFWSGAHLSGASAFQSEESRKTVLQNQPQSQKRTAPLLSVGSQEGAPGTDVVLPLYLTLPQGVELRKFSAEIEWVSKNLRFVKLERGIAPETVGADVGAKVTQTVQDSKGLEHSTLLVEASLVEEDPQRGIPEGLQAYLTFRISTEVQASAIELRPKLIAAESVGTPPRKFTQAEAESGKVNVELPGLPPYVSCFFFTH